MLQLEVLYRILDGLREEAIQAVERPGDEARNAFGFGRISGMLYAIAAMRLKIDEKVEEADQQEDERNRE